MLSFVALIALFTSAANAGCSEDNCYRNFVNNCGAASSFCANFTTATTTTLAATPTYFRAECTISRLSSACSCVFPKTLAPTATAPPCYPVPCPPGRQYVKDGQFNDRDYTDPNPPPVPQWDIATSNSDIQIYRGCSCSNNGADCFVYDSLPRIELARAHILPLMLTPARSGNSQYSAKSRAAGSGTITQNLTNVCGGKSYNISGLIATGSDPYYNISSSLSVYFDGAKVYGPEVVCSAANPCAVDARYGCPGGSFKGRYFSTIAAAAHSSPNVTFRVDYVDNGGQAWATWLDNVTVVGI